MRHLSVGFCAVLFLSLAACATAPPSFMKTPPGWKNIELRDGLDAEGAWQATVDSLVKEGFDLEQVDRGSGYIASAWNYVFTGAANENYRGRIVIKFRPDWKSLDIKTEAHWREVADGWGGGTGFWQAGWDTILNQRAYETIQGRVGRVVK